MSPSPPAWKPTGRISSALVDQLSDLDQRLQRQIVAIESGVNPVLVGERIRAFMAERQQAETVLSELDQQRHRPSVDLDGLPDLSKPLARAAASTAHLQGLPPDHRVDRNMDERRPPLRP
jgi:hypothetical protein